MFFKQTYYINTTLIICVLLGTSLTYRTPGASNVNRSGNVKRPMNAFMVWCTFILLEERKTIDKSKIYQKQQQSQNSRPKQNQQQPL